MNKNDKDMIFNLEIWLIILCLSFLVTLVSIIVDIFVIKLILIITCILMIWLYGIALYLILTRHEQNEEYFLEILDSLEHEDINSVYEISFEFYNRTCDEIEIYKNKIDKLKQKLEVFKGIILIIRYKHLMNKLNVRIMQRNLYKAALNYFSIKRYGAEYPKWTEREKL